MIRSTCASDAASLHEQARADIDASFRTLFDEQFVTILRLARFLGAGDPEDVAQETFARAYERWPALTSTGGRLERYLQATATNLVRSQGRHESVERRYVDVPVSAAVVASAEATALEDVSNEAFLAALNQLSLRHREALVLRFWLDLSEKQMASVMGCSIGSVKSHVSRGLSGLRACLRSENELRHRL